MSGIADATFVCIGCSKNYRWKPELAGRRVKCRCGQVMDCPSSPPAPNEEDGLYDFADEDLAAAAKGTIANEETGFRCPACQQSLQPGTIICPHCAFNLKTRKKMALASIAGGPVMAATSGAAAAVPSPLLGYAGAVRRAPAHPDAVGENMWIEYWIPTALILAGIFLSYLQLTRFDRIIYDSQGAMEILGLRLLVDIALLIVGSLLAIKLLDVSLGAPGPALLKITAIAIGPGAIAGMLGYLLHDPTNMIAFGIDILMAIGLFCYLFDFDAKDARIMAVIVAIIRIWLGYGVILLILHGGLTHMPRLGTAEVNSDREASDAIDAGWAVDAKTWLDRGGRLLGHSTLPWSYDLVNSLHKAGCTLVDVRANAGYAYVLYAELPSDQAKRAECFKAVALFFKQIDMRRPIVDKGQHYLFMPLM